PRRPPVVALAHLQQASAPCSCRRAAGQLRPRPGRRRAGPPAGWSRTARGRPPTDVGDRPLDDRGQPGRTAPLKGIVLTPVTCTPVLGLAACTIWPLTM